MYICQKFTESAKAVSDRNDTWKKIDIVEHLDRIKPVYRVHANGKN